MTVQHEEPLQGAPIRANVAPVVSSIRHRVAERTEYPPQERGISQYVRPTSEFLNVVQICLTSSPDTLRRGTLERLATPIFYPILNLAHQSSR